MDFIRAGGWTLAEILLEAPARGRLGDGWGENLPVFAEQQRAGKIQTAIGASPDARQAVQYRAAARMQAIGAGAVGHRRPSRSW